MATGVVVESNFAELTSAHETKRHLGAIQDIQDCITMGHNTVSPNPSGPTSGLYPP